MNGVGIRSIEVKGFFDGALGSFVQRERDSDLKSRVVVEVEEVVLSPNRLVRSANGIENGGQLRVEAGIVSLPESAERVLVRIARCWRRRGHSERCTGVILRDERNVTVGANSKALAIFRAALRTNHRRAQ